MKNQFKKVLSIVLVVVMCLSTFAIAASAETCEHANAKLVEHKDASCGQFGYDAYKCPDCGDEYVENITDPLEHDYSITVNEKGNCVTKDKVVEKCSNCDDERYVDGKDGSAITGASHTYGEVQYETVNGELKGYKLCSVCGDKASAEFAHGHDAEKMEIVLDTLVKPTCTADGKVTYKCKEVGCPYTVEVKIEKTHQIVLVPASTDTCSGNKEYYTCTLCHANFSDAAGANAITEIPQKGHVKADGDLGTVVTPNNCTTGTLEVRKFKCANTGCEEYITETATEVKHNPGAAQTVAATCTQWGYTYTQCKDCGTVSQTQALAPHHSFEVVDAENNKTIDPNATFTTVPVVCGDSAYKVYVCTNADCDAGHKACAAGACPVEDCERAHSVDNEIWIADGEVRNHNYSVKVSDGSSATCTVNGAKAHYTCEYCGEADPDRNGAPITASHTFAAATSVCTVAGKEYNYCTVCQKYFYKGDVVVAAGSAETHVIVTEIIQEATCKTDGKKATYCLGCGNKDEETTDIPATGCVYADEPTQVVPATCSSYEMKIYVCTNKNCDANGVHKVEFGTTYDKTATGHENYMKDMNIDLSTLTPEVLREATCTQKGLYKYECECGEFFTKQTADGFYGDCDVEDKAEVDANCATKTPGTKAGKYCNDHERWVEGGESFTHTADKTMDASTNVCGQDGWKEFNYCSICEGIAGYLDGLKAAEGTKLAGHTTTNTTAVEIPASCTSAGREAVTYCTGCYDTPEKVAALLAKEEYVIAKLDHDMKADDSKKDATCVAVGYVLNYCDDCSEAYISNFKYATGHNWDTEETDVEFTCTEDGYTYYECKNGCGHIVKDDTIAAGHVTNVDPEAEDYKKFTSSCEDIDEATLCAKCGETVEVSHDYNEELTRVDASCFDNGYTIKVCANCEDTTVVILEKIGQHTIYKDGDNWVIGAGSVKLEDECSAPTYTSTGLDVYECGVCEERFEIVVPKETGIDMTITADSAINAGAALINGGKVVFTVKINVSDLDATLLMSDFVYNKDVLTFVSADVAGIFDVEGEIATQAVVGNDTPGVVTIMASASKTADGKIAEKTLSGEVVIATLTFEISKSFYDDEIFVDGDVTIVGADATDMDDAITAVADKTVEVAQLGNINGDLDIDLIDVLAIRNIIDANIDAEEDAVVYDALADFDMDGDVDVADYIAFQQYMVSGKSYNQYFDHDAATRV